MRRFLPFAIAFSLFGIVPQAHAAWTTVWDFTAPGPLEGQWAQNNAILEKTPSGLRITANANGGVIRNVGTSHPVDSMKIVMTKGVKGVGVFVWHRSKDPEGQFVQLPFSMEGTNNEVIAFPLDNFPDWDPWSDAIGLGFGSAADVTIARIELYGRPSAETLMEYVKSFLQFDGYLPYSINFLWGPLMVGTPMARSTLFDGHPPLGMSGNRVFYGLLVLFAIVCVGWALSLRKHASAKKRRAPLAAFALFFCLLWISYDLRMGAEVMSYFINDLRSYVFAPAGKKEFRNTKSFYDVLEQSLDALTATPHYAVLTIEPSPFRKMAGYRTYPKSMPLFPGDDMKTAGAFLLFYSPDTGVDEKGRLMRLVNGNAVVLAERGTLKKFNDNAFLYIPSRP